MDDVLGLPVLRKFSTRYSRGLREATGPNEGLLKPQGRNSFSLFHTTGSTGYAQIPIFYSEPWDLDIERHAVARVWRMLGITSEDNVYDCYNPTHVGGYMFPGVCQIIGSGHEFKPAEKQLEETAQRLRDARNSGYPFTVLLAIPSSSGDPLGRKGTNFLTLYDETMDVFGKGGIDKVFLVGSGITPELIERIEAEMRDVKVSGAYGTAEHRPLSFSPTEGPTTRVCKYNQQHLTYGPHFTYVGRDEGNRVVPITTPGQEGDVYTIALRDGTPFINYQTGDVATIVTDACDCGLTSPVIGNIRRKNMEEIAGIGCRYD
ncbi:MAG: hypothetical protein HYY37_04085 [Candidatus Aenigmarchaeota archaeon]|nr:hypothetical protein [Candidatus Aenigmarchaeota archaeon]